ncbi:MAG TPA: hypothetical protein PKD54_01400, partial [Pirellulaceae bacterium]|nr:hypothetical protein [Pirellulaceae bacterium]
LPAVPPVALEDADGLAGTFFQRAMQEDLSAADMFRITTTSFMDAFTFDIRQIIKSCVHQVLPSGHLIPFCAYNLFYRDGNVPLPPLKDGISRASAHRPVGRSTALPVVMGDT